MTGGLVVVLGETGKNFAAGMSGGIAYVNNANGQFESRLNAEMVDLDPLGDADLELLKKMIRNHYSYTQSELAQEILEHWDKAKDHFVKVMPKDYKAVLAEKNEEPNLTVKEAVLAN